ncbi:MAG: metallophosphoesterase [Verrucomicrobiota bacterium]
MQIERAYEYGGEVDWLSLADRMGEAALRQRIQKQNVNADRSMRGLRFFSRDLIKYAARGAFTICGLASRGSRNFRDIQVVHHRVPLKALPAELTGLKILQLSDLHIDLDLTLAAVIAERVQGLEYDLAVITGDFRNNNTGDFSRVLSGTRVVLEALKGPVYGILGNHDDLEIAVGMEAMGMRMLLNEAVEVSVRAGLFWLCGIDDAHYYRTYDIPRTLQSVPTGAFKVLLSHSPETYQAAGDAGFDYFLCGHTHGGQICLPGGVPVITRSNSPRWCARGSWEWEGMPGYTTTGTGGCGVALRLNCPPEVVVHEFKHKDYVQ